MVSILLEDELLLRSFQPEDAPELFRAVDASRQHLRHWLNWVDATTKAEHSLQFIQQSLQQLNSQEAIALGLFSKLQIIGSIGMHNWDHKLRKAMLGYWIDKEHEGKGIIQRGMRRFINFLFEKTDLNKLEIHFVPANTRSAVVAEKLGFKTEGILRQSILRNGMLEDVVVTGLLKSEWKG